ncbi:Uncharacterised protein [Mycoplasmopsis citelli]|uniref:ICEF Integrative Conjugal Element-II n=1 Tax=Mycoplasmopsis citelli TaxID=171281 RepID=A0A449B0Z5_9BACT|nr:hypothetical protein [Mycoplasmopsis citelli]VEU74277.1 Uncharacterised protein [Mycoplasmopsis citelli]
MSNVQQAKNTLKKVQQQIQKLKETKNKQKFNRYRFSGRISDQNDALKFEKWREKLYSNNISLNSELTNAIIKYIDDQEFDDTIDVVKERLHDYLRKAVYAGTKSVHNKLNRQFKYLNARLDIIDQKLNALMNILLNKVDIKTVNAENIQSNLYNEFFTFIKTKKMIDTIIIEAEKLDKSEEEQLSSYLNKNYSIMLDKHENNLDLKGMHKNEKNK